jgi:hypothetical protein
MGNRLEHIVLRGPQAENWVVCNPAQQRVYDPMGIVRRHEFFVIQVPPKYTTDVRYGYEQHIDLDFSALSRCLDPSGRRFAFPSMLLKARKLSGSTQWQQHLS